MLLVGLANPQMRIEIEATGYGAAVGGELWVVPQNGSAFGSSPRGDRLASFNILTRLVRRLLLSTFAAICVLPLHGCRTLQGHVDDEFYCNPVDSSNSNYYGLWVTDGTSLGVQELEPGTQGTNALNPYYMTPIGNDVLFRGTDPSGKNGLWITNGTQAGTSELLAGTQGAKNLSPYYLSRVNGYVVFYGIDASGNAGLWSTNGTALGTSELVPGTQGTMELMPYNFVNMGTWSIFVGIDSGGNAGLWATNGTQAGTSEIEPGTQGAHNLHPYDLVSFSSQVLFAGQNSSGSGDPGVWITNGAKPAAPAIARRRAARRHPNSCCAVIP